MKKVFTIISLMLLFGATNAQNIFELNIEDVEDNQFWSFCRNDYDSIIIESDDPACDWWTGGSLPYYDVSIFPYDATNPGFTVYGKRLAIAPLQGGQNYEVFYQGCDGAQLYYKRLYFYFSDFQVPEPWTQSFVWKRAGKTITLFAMANDCSYQWSTGYSYDAITVSQPGTYWVRIYNGCGELTDTIQVRDNVEIYRSGVDPATNKNRVLWQTTPEQAQYVSSVKVERDGMVVGTVPYTDGEFLDNIGSENAARIYRITAIANDGTECPLPSYQFGTFNTIISPDIANPNLMNFSWEDPFIEEGLPYSVVAYRIGRFNENTGEFNVIDQLSANVHLGKYNMDLFDGEYGIVAAVFNNAKNRDNEELAFSNRSDNEIVGIGEQNGENFGIYPNPAKDCFTVEGTGVITVTNTLGQTILTQEIDGKATIELPQGIYFVKLGDAVRKIVVE